MADSANYLLNLVITANNKATEEINKLGKSVDSVKGNVVQLSESTKKTLKTIGITATAITGTVVALGKSFVDAAMENEPLQRSFERLSESAGIAGDEMLSAMRKASKGTVSDTKLMSAANTALSLNVVKSADDMATLMEIARVKGQAMGRSMEEALDDIVRGLGRASPMILDNLGIVINQTEAQEEYAKSIGKTADQLTDAEKKQALVNAVVKQGKQELLETGDLQLTTAERLQVVNAQRENMKNTIGDALLPVIQKVLEVITPIIQKVGDWINEHPKLVANIMLAVGAISGLIAVISGLALAIPAITTAIGVLSGPIGRIIGAVVLLGTARANNRGGIRDKTQEVVDKISEIVKPRLDKIQERRDKRGRAVKEGLGVVRESIKNIFGAAIDIICGLVEGFFQYIDILMKLFTGDFEGAREGIQQFRAGIRDTMAKVGEDLFGGALDWIADKLVAFGDRFKNTRNKIKDRVVGIANAMREGIKQGFEFWIALFTGDRETVYGIANQRMTSLDTMLTSAFGETRTNIKNGCQQFINDVISKFTALKDKVKSIVQSIKDAWNSTKDAVGGAAKKARDVVSSPFKAGGGDVYAGNSYIVGEKGPELFVPNQKGSIVPTNQITNNNGIEININGAVVRNDNDIQAIADEITRRIKLEKNFGIA